MGKTAVNDGEDGAHRVVDVLRRWRDGENPSGRDEAAVTTSGDRGGDPEV